MCTSINNKNCNYKPAKSFITQNHLIILWKKNTGKKFVTQGILSRHECGYPEQACIDIDKNSVQVSSKTLFPLGSSSTRRDMVRSTVNSTDHDTLPVV